MSVCLGLKLLKNILTSVYDFLPLIGAAEKLFRLSLNMLTIPLTKFLTDKLLSVMSKPNIPRPMN